MSLETQSAPASRSPGPSDNHFRAFYGFFDRDGLRQTLTQGAVAVDPSASRLLGAEVGHVLARRLFNWPIDLSLDFAVTDTVGTGVPSDFLSFRLMPKLYFNFPVAGAPRFVFGTGPSYAERVSSDERWSIMVHDGQAETSNWLNAVFVGIDLNIGHLAGSPKLDGVHVGIGDEHRSGVFGLIHGIIGGCDYKSVYAEMEL